MSEVRSSASEVQALEPEASNLKIELREEQSNSRHFSSLTLNCHALKLF